MLKACPQLRLENFNRLKFFNSAILCFASGLTSASQNIKKIKFMVNKWNHLSYIKKSLLCISFRKSVHFIV